MFTDCPSCHRQFRLRAGQLSAAGGLVQCGYCGKQFNSLERLHDQPLPRGYESTPADDQKEPPSGETGFNIRERGGGAPAGRVDPEAETEEAIRPVDSEAETEEAMRPVDAEAETEEASRPVDPEAETEQALPEWLVEEKPRRSRLSRFAWFTGAVILILIMASQLAWYNRDLLLSRYPELLPWARQVCEHLQCELIRHRDLASIEVINRDVRDHPRYRDALLVNATISNQAAEMQSFPVVQLSLFNTAGKVIAYRRFAPEEYLDESIDIERGMPPGKPVHIVLEVTGPTQGAVSFEFQFMEQK